MDLTQGATMSAKQVLFNAGAREKVTVPPRPPSWRTRSSLAHAIFAQGVRNITAGASGIELKRGLERGLAAAVQAIRTLSRPVQTQRERMQVAKISAHNDPEIGRQVAEAPEKVGAEGAITVEEAKGMETSIEIVEGTPGRRMPGARSRLRSPPRWHRRWTPRPGSSPAGSP
jgi:hypothetical protein